VEGKLQDGRENEIYSPITGGRENEPLIKEFINIPS